MPPRAARRAWKKCKAYSPLWITDFWEKVVNMEKRGVVLNWNTFAKPSMWSIINSTGQTTFYKCQQVIMVRNDQYLYISQFPKLKETIYNVENLFWFKFNMWATWCGLCGLNLNLILKCIPEEQLVCSCLTVISEDWVPEVPYFSRFKSKVHVSEHQNKVNFYFLSSFYLKFNFYY